MAYMATSLTHALPAPNYSGEYERATNRTNRANTKGPRILDATSLSDTQIILKVRTSWQGSFYSELHR